MTDEHCIRGDFLRFLLLGGDEQAPVHERGVVIEGGYIEGLLNLSGANVPVDLILIKCFFAKKIYAQDAKFGGVLILTESHLANGLAADRLKCASSLFLRNGFKVNGEVHLQGALIGGNLDCNGGHFEALNIDDTNIRGAVLFGDGFTASGRVRLQGAQVGGDLDCSGGIFEFDDGNALCADQVNVSGSVLLSNSFKAKGQVRLQGAQIGCDLVCSGGQFEAKKGPALYATRIKVGGRVSLRKGFKAKGEVTLQDARIGGSLGCDGGHITAEDGDALSLERANIAGSVFLRNGFRANGCVDLTAAQIGSILSCDAGHFEVKNGSAIYGPRLNVKGNVCMSKDFRAIGAVNLKSAQIGGNFECSQGDFEVRDGGAALSLSSAVIQGVCMLKEFAQPACIDASHAQVGVLDDDNLQAWGQGSILDGFRYASLGGAASTSGDARLKWLHIQQESHLSDSDFRPQPWRQLQRGLREMGHAEDAKQVGIAYEDHLRKIGRVGKTPKDTVLELAWLMRIVTRGAHWAFGQLAGYGYRPVRLVIWMLGVWLVCGATYWWLALPPRSALAPSDPLVFQDDRYKKCQPDHIDKEGKKGNWYLCSSLRGEYASFSPLAYSLDLLLPVVDLGQEKSWDAFIPETKESPKEEFFFNWHWGHAARLLNWIETLFGWISSLLLVAIISGFSRRNDES
ncbi:MAG: hypothetical protein KA972_05960 [Brachymonas sp.]|nr:hypothetical protein [Brachymonas sp.]